MDYTEIDKARGLSGLRLVLTAGVPGPWGEAAKGILHVKGLGYAAVRQEGGLANEKLRAWTGFDNAPQLVYAEEPPRAGWAEILGLAERLAPEPGLIPEDPRERAGMFGLAQELCGEMGFGWCRRLMLLDPILSRDPGGPNAALDGPRRLGRKYGYSARAAAVAPRRIQEVLELLSARLRAQRAEGRAYLAGDALSALDIYWAVFAAMVEPLPHELCPMSDLMRKMYTLLDPKLRKALDPALLEHRDRIYRDHLALPLDF